MLLQTGTEWDKVQHVQWLVRVAAGHHLYLMRCLRQSLVLQWLLARQDIVTDLQFGVQKEAGKLRAHAWLEYDGRPIGQPHNIAECFVALMTKEQVIEQHLRRC